MILERVRHTLSLSNERAKILVVDDQTINIMALNEVFKSDFDVLMALDGVSALEQARNQSPDIILLDVVMPGMDGHEVCRRLKSDPLTEDIPVIFVTSRTDGEDEASGFALGAVDYINKPINPVTVQARVRTQLAVKLQYQIIKNMALTDGVTGIGNRRRFDEALQTLWRQCMRDEQPLTLMLLDVDHFKAFNDHYGHLAGDECLAQVAQCIRQVLKRPSDLLCRYGGDELAALLPNTDLAGAEHLARLIQEQLIQQAIPHEHSTAAASVSLSIGLASQVPAAELDADKLLVLADQALYRAKHEGRNCFRSWDLQPAQCEASL
ncbi:diguanylate cyclase domain-containing protein [Shewanella sedimentimangrovi]|uniref:diguanylate cyclase n=1 Tax=Shewanella sedimentimangrovi TaxID=2814293 RepID=A0ABX7R3K5_9GAMM|nr:diguanylate cyclase [Shewanella sedimentimangrovi]QSX37678.1 diguanylate cyclase [Shewanella sedimentimangrovi]